MGSPRFLGNDDLLLMLDIVAVKAFLHQLAAFGAGNVPDTVDSFGPHHFEIPFKPLAGMFFGICIGNTAAHLITAAGTSRHPADIGGALGSTVLQPPNLDLNALDVSFEFPEPP